jgi:hypothetical protein
MHADASTSGGRSLLEDIDRQQDDLLEQLDALNTRIERAIREWVVAADPAAAPMAEPF